MCLLQISSIVKDSRRLVINCLPVVYLQRYMHGTLYTGRPLLVVQMIANNGLTSIGGLEIDLRFVNIPAKKQGHLWAIQTKPVQPLSLLLVTRAEFRRLIIPSLLLIGALETLASLRGYRMTWPWLQKRGKHNPL